ncbi:hypothetical protein SRHO_G00159930 [Serrasalmus rhombeus]
MDWNAVRLYYEQSVVPLIEVAHLDVLGYRPQWRLGINSHYLTTLDHLKLGLKSDIGEGQPYFSRTSLLRLRPNPILRWQCAKIMQRPIKVLTLSITFRMKTYNVLLLAEHTHAHSPSPQTHSKIREGERKCVLLTKTAR